MSRIICFALFLFYVVVRFGECTNDNYEYNTEIDCDIQPGFIKTRLSKIEKLQGIIGSIFGKGGDNTTSRNYGEFLEVVSQVDPQVIAPGTKWCGDGNVAKDEDDLGPFSKVDACCRDHDNCKNNIETGQKLVNLHNQGLFTRSACDCDTKFFKCLKAANKVVGFNIGKTYFNILGPQCFKCVCPTENCNPEKHTECKDHCKKYKWVDNERY